MSSKFTGALLVAAGLAFPSSASALTLSGVLDVNGAVRVTETVIDFVPPIAGGTGLENIASTTTFRVNGVLVAACSLCVTAKDLDQTIYPVSGFTTPLDFYEQLSQFPTLNFQLQDILSCGELGGGTCSLGAGSPFVFNQTSLGTEVKFGVTGDVFLVGDPDIFNFSALYTAQFTGLTIDQVLFSFAPNCVPGVPNAIGDPQTCTFIDTSFSATKIALRENPIPEPATLLLLGTGLVGAAARARRRRNTSV